MISAKILADSVNLVGDRLVSYELTYPRYVHSELLVHRTFSRNAASSRAIPTTKRISAILTDPVMPLYWGTNQPGMQAGVELSPDVIEKAEAAWLKARDAVAKCSAELYSLGVAKEIANRPLEPWLNITVLLTATDFDNFFALRVHPMAQPEIQELATQMLELYLSHEPTKLNFGQWHNPFAGIAPEQKEDIQLKIAVARCARVSYDTFDKKFSVDDDIALYDRLLESKHHSAFEHCAQVGEPGYHGNFRGFTQLRKMVETFEHIDLHQILAKARS